MIQVPFNFVAACVWRTNRNVLTIQDSNGAHTQIVSYENFATECTIGHIQLFTALISCASKGTQNYSFQFFFLFTKIILFYNGSEFTLKYRKNNLNANAYKPQDENCDILTRPWEWGVWHFFIQTSSKYKSIFLASAAAVQRVQREDGAL